MESFLPTNSNPVKIQEEEPITKICIFNEEGNVTHIMIFANIFDQESSNETNDDDDDDNDDDDDDSTVQNTPTFRSRDEYSVYFSEEEWSLYESISVQYCLVPSRIHMDDTVQEIKYKIWNMLFAEEYQTDFSIKRFVRTLLGGGEADATLNNPVEDIYGDNEQPFSYEEMYMFHVVESTFQLLPWYNTVTNHEQRPLSQPLCMQLLANYLVGQTENLDKLSTSSILDPDAGHAQDIPYHLLEENDWFRETQKWQKMSLGARFQFPTPPILRDKDEYFCASPFDIQRNVFLEHAPNRKPKMSHDTDMWLHTGKARYNTIFLCLAKPVLQAAKTAKIPYDMIRDIYFPKLPKGSYESFVRQQKTVFIQNTRKDASRSKMLEYQEKIDAMYDLYYQSHKTPSEYTVKYIENGISDFYFIKHPYETQSLPIQTIFRNIHATEQIPIIQYCSRRFKSQSMYRFYCNGRTEMGSKIPIVSPILKSSSALTDVKLSGRREQLILYVRHNQTDAVKNPSGEIHSLDDFLRISFETNGNVHFEGHLQKPIAYDEFDTWFNESAQPAFEHMNAMLIPMGFTVKKLQTLRDQYMQTVYLHISCKVNLERPLDLNSHMGCLSSLFFHKFENIKEKKKIIGLDMIYMRVEDFERLTPADEYISQKIREHSNRTLHDGMLKNMLSSKFPKEDPAALIQSYRAREAQRVIPGRFTNQERSMNQNGGFVTSIRRYDVFAYDYEFKIKFIHNIGYLDTIPKLLDSVLRILTRPTREITQLCSTATVQKYTKPMDSQKYNDELPLLDESIVDNTFQDEDAVIDMNKIDEDDIRSFLSEKEFGFDDDNDESSPITTDFPEDKPVMDMNNDMDNDMNMEMNMEMNDDILLQEQATGEVQRTEQPEEKPVEEIPESDDEEMFEVMSEQDQLEEPVEEPVEDDDDEISLDEDDVGVVQDDDGLGSDVELDSTDGNTESASTTEDNLDAFSGGARMNAKDEWKSASQYYMARVQQRDEDLHKGIKKQWNRINQKDKPIILTEEEFSSLENDIEREKAANPESNYYSNVMKYRKKQGKHLYYVCPKYWCTKPGQEGVLSQEQVDSGVCGKIITNPTKRGENEYILQGNDKAPQPGFVNRNDGDKEFFPDGSQVCYPKCVQNFDGKQAIVRSECNPTEYGDETNLPKTVQVQFKPNQAPVEPVQVNAGPTETTTEVPIPPNDTCAYKGPIYLENIREKYKDILNVSKILTHKRFGRLPNSVQKLLNSRFNNNRLITNSNEYALLRYGVQKTKNNQETFLACLADIYAYERNEVDAMPLPEFRKRLAESVSLDAFVGLHNGSIAALFQPSVEDVDALNSANLEKYAESDFYRQLNVREESHLAFLKSSVASLENFKRYLQDENVHVDHTFLWEIIGSPNDLLFCMGYNLMIVETFDEDDKVGVLCPKNPYAMRLYDPSKSTILLLKMKDDIYTPMYLIRSSSTVKKGKKQEVEEKFHVVKVMHPRETDHPVYEVIKQLSKTLNMNCTAKDPVQYGFQHAVNAAFTFTALTKMRQIKVVGAIWNYRGKVIGFSVQKVVDDAGNGIADANKLKENGTFMIPCFPSGLRPEIVRENNLVFKWMDNDENWRDYSSTMEFLTFMHDASRALIPDGKHSILSCKPVARVVQDKHIIGIMTKSHLYVPVFPPKKISQMKEPLGDALDNVQPIIQSDRNSADKELVLGKPNATHKDLHMMHLETQFYITFRNKMRQILNEFSQNRHIRKEIIALYQDDKKTRNEKLNGFLQKLTAIGNNHFTFSSYDDETLLNIPTIHLCNSTDCEKLVYYVSTGNDKYQLKIPSKNLVSGESNNPGYFRRLSEEILSHRMIHLFVLYPSEYANFGNDEINVSPDEIIVQYDQLTTSFFEKMRKRLNDNYIREHTYETVPSEKKVYEKVIELSDISK